MIRCEDLKFVSAQLWNQSCSEPLKLSRFHRILQEPSFDLQPGKEFGQQLFWCCHDVVFLSASFSTAQGLCPVPSRKASESRLLPVCVVERESEDWSLAVGLSVGFKAWRRRPWRVAVLFLVTQKWCFQGSTVQFLTSQFSHKPFGRFLYIPCRVFGQFFRSQLLGICQQFRTENGDANIGENLKQVQTLELQFGATTKIENWIPQWDNFSELPVVCWDFPNKGAGHWGSTVGIVGGFFSS